MCGTEMWASLLTIWGKGGREGGLILHGRRYAGGVAARQGGVEASFM